MYTYIHTHTYIHTPTRYLLESFVRAKVGATERTTDNLLPIASCMVGPLKHTLHMHVSATPCSTPRHAFHRAVCVHVRICICECLFRCGGHELRACNAVIAVVREKTLIHAVVGMGSTHDTAPLCVISSLNPHHPTALSFHVETRTQIHTYSISSSWQIGHTSSGSMSRLTTSTILPPPSGGYTHWINATQLLLLDSRQ